MPIKGRGVINQRSGLGAYMITKMRVPHALYLHGIENLTETEKSCW